MHGGETVEGIYTEKEIMLSLWAGGGGRGTVVGTATRKLNCFKRQENKSLQFGGKISEQRSPSLGCNGTVWVQDTFTFRSSQS